MSDRQEEARVNEPTMLDRVRDALARHQWVGANEVWACACGVEGIHGEGDGPDAHVNDMLCAVIAVELARTNATDP